MHPIRLFFLHHNKLMIDAFTSATENDGVLEVVGSSDDLNVALAAIPQLQVDLVLIGAWLDPEPSRPAIRRLKGLYPKIKVLPLGLSTDEEILECLEAGANGYLPDDAGLQDTVETLQALHQGIAQTSALLASNVLRKVSLLARQVSQKSEASAQEIHLTRREREVLEQLVAGQSNQQIADEFGVSLATVKVHVHRILRKLGVGSRREAVRKALDLRLLTR